MSNSLSLESRLRLHPAMNQLEACERFKPDAYGFMKKKVEEKLPEKLTQLNAQLEEAKNKIAAGDFWGVRIELISIAQDDFRYYSDEVKKISDEASTLFEVTCLDKADQAIRAGKFDIAKRYALEVIYPNFTKTTIERAQAIINNCDSVLLDEADQASKEGLHLKAIWIAKVVNDRNVGNSSEPNVKRAYAIISRGVPVNNKGSIDNILKIAEHWMKRNKFETCERLLRRVEKTNGSDEAVRTRIQNLRAQYLHLNIVVIDETINNGEK